MRAIAIAAALSLVAVATASGTRAQTQAARVTQRPIQAPTPATAQLACPSAGSCVSVGGSELLVERAGKWKLVKLPASANLLSLACPAAGACVASGRFGERRVLVVTQTGGKWVTNMPALPGNPADPSFPALSSVTCPSKGDCVAVGSYEFSVQTPVVVEERNGTWGDGTEAPLPSNAATSRDPNYTNVGGSLYQVACVSEAQCTAVGTYANKDQQYSDYGWFLTNGQNPSTAHLPAGAAIVGNSERAGTSPFFGFVGLSCPGGHCTAVGGYVDSHDDEHGVIFTQHPGSGWARGTSAPVPANAGRNPAGPNEYENPLASLSCAAAANCAATGWYVDRSKQRRGLLLTEARGKWTASELVLPAGAPRHATPILGQVTCASPGNCVAIGDYASGGKTYGFLVVERRGKWGRGMKAALPANAAKTSHSFLNAISCASASRCTVVGNYADRSGKTRGLILSLRLS